MTTSYDYRKYGVLYVDDEEQALKYFRKGLEKDFRVLTANGVPDAITQLDREAGQIGVLITDQRMPNQTGVELLTHARQKWPGIVRILLTAYADIDSAIAAVNAGAIYKYITKPADLKQLRESLRAAMELFLNTGERETLLRERLGVIHRMVVADRVRSLAAMAGGISHHLRNSMTALTCFLEEATPVRSGDPSAGALLADPQFAQQLWELARKEREHLLDIVRRVGQSAAEPSCSSPQEIEAPEVIRRGIQAAAAELGAKTVQVSAEAGLPRLRLDPDCATRLLRTLLAYVARLTPAAKLEVSIKPSLVGTAAGIRFRISAEGPAWSDNDVASFFTPFAFPAADPSDLGLDLLAAFFTAYQHGGDILVHKSAPDGPGFELLLPADPSAAQRPELQDSLLEKLFTRFDSPAAEKPQPSKAA